MKKLCLILATIILSANQAFATGWVVGEPLGTRPISDLDSYIGANNAALDLMLAGYRQNVQIQYLSAATLTVAAGEVKVSNSGGTIRLMLRNTSATTVSWSDIDTGSEAVSTTYYVYACASAITDTTFTIKVSASSSAPTGITYYKRLGSFYNDSSGNITLINNDDDDKEFGDWVSKTHNTVYQATVDGFVLAFSALTSYTYFYGYSDGTSSPSTLRAYQGLTQSNTETRSIMFPVKKGDYYKVYSTSGSATTFWVPLQ